MSVTREDIKKADSILRFWLTDAKVLKDAKKIADVKHLKKVLDGLTK